MEGRREGTRDGVTAGVDPGEELVEGVADFVLLIEYRRGHIHVSDRKGLEAVACDCYPVVRELHEGLYQ